MRLLTQTISGHKGGGGGSTYTPVEQADDLLSVAKLKMLVAISEGEIQGELTAQQIYLDDTPLASDNGTYNFTGVSWEYRTGTQDQSYIAGMPEIDNESSVSVEVTTNQPWVRNFTNLNLDAVRIKLSLPVQYLYKDNGDMVGTTTQYVIDLATDGGAWQTVVDAVFNGKTTSEYQRDHRINLPSAHTGWSVRVRRITADSSSSKLLNAFKVAAFAEVIDSKLRYPNTALLYIELDSSQFNGSVPKVTCKPKGKIIRVPTTYDPVARTYSGTWDGSFKWAYSNNPAWIFYDLVLNKIYGMGNRVDATMIDKWELYSIAQYCDERVADGTGGTEPRFTCNAFIQSQQDAYTVLKDIAAIFRGITFWGNDQIFVRADVPQDDVDFVYHAANVVNGQFTYAGGSYKNRYTSCQVSWSDPQNHYTDTIEGVYDPDLVQRYGVNETQVTAIGCTSQSEAHRRGRWVMLSNAKDGTISFGVGLDGYIPLPAEIIGVADPFRAGKQNGGRISAVDGVRVTLDREVDYAPGDRLVANLPDGTAQTRTISAVSADKKTVTVATGFRQTPVPGAVWAIDSDSLAIQYFRVTAIASNDDGTFTVSGVQHDPNKYRFIDDGVRIESAPVTVTPGSVMAAPANIVISESSYVYQGASVSSLNASWARVDGAISYVAQWRKDKGDWINVSQTSATGFSVSGIYAGVYDVRVRAVNAAEVSSPWGYADSTTLNGKVGRPGTPVSLLASDNTVWAVDITWAFPDGAGDTAYTQLQYATTNDGANPLDLTLVPYPQANYQHGPMPAGVSRWYRARLVDRIGNTGDWTAWVMGQSSAEADAYLAVVADQFMSAEDGKALMSQLETTPEAILQNALANFDTVNQQWAQFGDNKAGIVQAQKVAADAGRAVAALETDVTARFAQESAQTSAAIQQKMTAYADASGGSAIYTLKTGVAYGGVNYDAGLSVAVTINGQSVDTRVAINANQFVLMSGSGNNLYSPFAVVNGQVFISSAFIQDGSIDNAKIGNFIQSRNYVSGSTGWAINKDGGAEFNNAVFRGDIYAENGWFHGTVKAARIEGDIGDTLALVEYRWGRMVGQAGFLANGTSLDFHLANVRQDPDIYRRIAFVGMVSLQIPQNTYCRASLVRSGVEVWAADVNASPLFGSSDTNMKLLTLSGLFGDIPQGTGTYEFVLRLTNNSTANWTNASVHVQLTGFTLRAGSIFF